MSGTPHTKHKALIITFSVIAGVLFLSLLGFILFKCCLAPGCTEHQKQNVNTENNNNEEEMNPHSSAVVDPNTAPIDPRIRIAALGERERGGVPVLGLDREAIPARYLAPQPTNMNNNNMNHSHLGRYVVSPPVLHTEETIVSQDIEPNRNEDLPIDGDVLLPRVLTVGDGAPLPPSVFGFSTSFPSGSKSITYYERRVPSFTVYGSSRYMEEEEYEEEGEQKVGGRS